MVAYVSDESGNDDIWIVTLDGTRPYRLTSDTGREWGPAWFPDGRALAFGSSRGGGGSGIWKIPALGGSPTLLVDDAADPDVSADGRRLAFVRPGADGGENRVFVAEFDDLSHPRQLSFREHGLWDHSSPAWSPDGRWLCYSSQRSLWLVEADGSTPPRLLSSDGGADFHGSWSPDGDHIYFSSYRDGTLAIWRMSLSDNVAERVTAGTGPESQPDLSPDGRVLVYSTDNLNPDLILRTAHHERIALTGTSSEVDPVLMPDLGGLLFISDRWGGVQNLWLLPLNEGTPTGEPPRRLSPPGGSTVYPALSPDGRWVAYYRVIDGQRDIWAQPIDGNSAVQLTRHPASDLQPAWSPDGRRIVFVSERGGGSDLWVLDFDEGEAIGSAERLARTQGVALLTPAWSPDGKWIAHTCRRGNDSRVCLVPADGSAPSRAITEDVKARRVRWDTTTGDLLVSADWGGPTTTLRRLDPSGEWSAEFSPPVIFGPEASWASFDQVRGGAWLVYTQERRSGNIWIMEAQDGEY
jgi:Tol biopolymer transport system component